MTITAEKTISDIARESLAAVRLFERYGIDYCCGGKRPLREACDEKGLDFTAVSSELDQALIAAPADETDWNTAPLTDLANHINRKHHEYLKLELPRLAQRLEKVMKVYGEQDAPTLAGLPGIFFALKQELESHLHKEEVILFPYVEQFERSLRQNSLVPPIPFGTVANPIACMVSEHDDAGEALRAMREMTRDYAIPDHACITYRSLLSGLKELEEDLHLHIHLENNILFPRAIEMEKQAQSL